MSRRSTTSALIDLVEHLIDDLVEGKTVLGLLDQRLILSKLSSLGIKGTALKWFKSYLQERKNVVEIRLVLKEPGRVSLGHFLTWQPLFLATGKQPQTFILFICSKAEDGPEAMITRPPPPIHNQSYFGPPGPMPMDFRSQQWMSGGWGGPPRMMHSQFFHRGRGNHNQRMFFPQSRGMRPHQNYNYNNYNQNMWNRPPPPFMEGMPPMPQGGEAFHNQGAGSSWMPNTTVPPPLPPQSQANQFDPNQFPQTAENGETSFSGTNAKKKKKDKLGKPPAYTSRPWNREDAEKALALENECQKNSTEQSLVIRFPDPELSKDIVKKFHPLIDSVHFQAPSGARFCFAQLVDGANVDKVISDLEKIKFGVGKLKAERKLTKTEEPVTPEAIDPYTQRSKSSGLVDNVIAESRRPFSWCIALLYFRVLPLHFSKHKNSIKTNMIKLKLNSLLKKHSKLVFILDHTPPPKMRVPCLLADVNERKTSLEIVPISKISNSRGSDQKYKLNCYGKAIMYRANHVMPPMVRHALPEAKLQTKARALYGVCAVWRGECLDTASIVSNNVTRQLYFDA
ncbi:hypothetical protein J6590_022495 [Homalodisca vitripennis]|nr:hypothetical protein J6590_022495 [Homalodisca vitripennis]